MGTVQTVQKISFEDLIDVVFKNKHMYTLINTLAITEQDCLISNTLPAQLEESVINELISRNKKQYIIIYGKNTNDPKLAEKYDQLTKLGFSNLYVYPGGLFEWLLLQDIYGGDNFPTTSKPKDIFSYRPTKTLL